MALVYKGEPTKKFVNKIGLVTIDSRTSQEALAAAKADGIEGIEEDTTTAIVEAASPTNKQPKKPNTDEPGT